MLGNTTGNPGVSWANLYCTHLTLTPHLAGRGFAGTGMGFGGFHGSFPGFAGDFRASWVNIPILGSTNTNATVTIYDYLRYTIPIDV